MHSRIIVNHIASDSIYILHIRMYVSNVNLRFGNDREISNDYGPPKGDYFKPSGNINFT